MACARSATWPMTDPIADRRQRALEAGEDADDYSQYTYRSIETAIEVATQAKITAEMLATMDPAVGNRETRLKAAFRAAGFEVVE